MMLTLLDSLDAQQHLVLSGVSWLDYEQTLNEVGERSIRVAFLDGVMEIMSPLPEHEALKRAIGSLIVATAVERGVPMKSFGSSTFRLEKEAAGREPDECFYFNEIDSVKGMKRFDPAIHRAPDLWVEIDVFSPSAMREPICARLGVPEIWRYSNERLTIRLLTSDSVYQDSAASIALPFLPIVELPPFIQKFVEGDETASIREFQQWVRSL